MPTCVLNFLACQYFSGTEKAGAEHKVCYAVFCYDTSFFIICELIAFFPFDLNQVRSLFIFSLPFVICTCNAKTL